MKTLSLSAPSDDDHTPNVLKLLNSISFKDLRPEWVGLLGCQDVQRARAALENQAAAHSGKLEVELKGRIEHLRLFELPSKQVEHDRLVAELRALPEFVEATHRRMVCPRDWLSRIEVGVLGATGATVLFIGWQNSSQLTLEHIQDTFASYCLTAPLLLLPLTAHVANKTLRISPKWITTILGGIGITGGCLLVSALIGGGPAEADAATDWTKLLAAPLDKGRLLLAQALLECSLGTILMHHVEHLLTAEVATQIRNPGVVKGRQDLQAVIEKMGGLNDEISSHEGSLGQLQRAQAAWVETQLGAWNNMR